MISKKNAQIVFFLGGTFTLVGAVLQLIDYKWAPYVFSVGAATLILLQFFTLLQNKDLSFREERLHRTTFITSLLLGLAAYLMFIHSNYWVLAVLIYALSLFFISFRSSE